MCLYDDESSLTGYDLKFNFSRWVMSDSLQPHGLQHARLPCPSSTLKVYSDSCPLTWWCHTNHLILCCPLLLLPSIFPSIRVFFSELALRVRWPKCWSFSFSISPSNENSGLISFRWIGWISLLSKGLSIVFSNTTVQKHQFFSAQLSLWSSSHIHTGLLEKPKLWLGQTFAGKVMSLLFKKC